MHFFIINLKPIAQTFVKFSSEVMDDLKNNKFKPKLTL